MTRLYKEYKEKIVSKLMKEFEYKNIHQVPKLDKIVVNMCIGEASQDSKKLQAAIDELAAITGQKPVITRAKKSIAGFKIRDNWPIGCMVTLRREKMYEFLDRLINISIPRIRDFRGLNARAFDGRGNYNMGVKEQIIFPEIDYDKIDALRGMNITITTTAKTDEEGRALLEAFKFPFRQ